MKMSLALFQDLENDVKALMQEYRESGYHPAFTDSDMWGMFHTIMFDRMNDDNHPAFTTGNRKRKFPFWSRNGETRDMQGNDHWLNRFYKEEDLDDSHIRTALMRIRKRVEG